MALIASLAALAAPKGVEVVAVDDPDWPGRQVLEGTRLKVKDSATSVVVDMLAACAMQLMDQL